MRRIYTKTSYEYRNAKNIATLINHFAFMLIKTEPGHETLTGMFHDFHASVIHILHIMSWSQFPVIPQCKPRLYHTSSSQFQSGRQFVTFQWDIS